MAISESSDGIVLDVSRHCFSFSSYFFPPFYPARVCARVIHFNDQCLSCCKDTFSVPSIARFIVQSHYGIMSACSKLHACASYNYPPPMIDFTVLIMGHVIQFNVRC